MSNMFGSPQYVFGSPQYVFGSPQYVFYPDGAHMEQIFLLATKKMFKLKSSLAETFLNTC